MFVHKLCVCVCVRACMHVCIYEKLRKTKITVNLLVVVIEFFWKNILHNLTLYFNLTALCNTDSSVRLLFLLYRFCIFSEWVGTAGRTHRLALHTNSPPPLHEESQIVRQVISTNSWKSFVNQCTQRFIKHLPCDDLYRWKCDVKEQSVNCVCYTRVQSTPHPRKKKFSGFSKCWNVSPQYQQKVELLLIFWQ